MLPKRNTVKPAGKLDSNDRQKDTVGSLAKKGNKGLGAYDFHTCCICKKVISNRRNLIRHLETVHSKGVKFHCDLCPKFYFSKGEIFEHVKTHAKKNFACNICDYKTWNRALLKAHALSHVPKVDCPICNRQVKNLKLHLKSHKHKETCPVCNKMLHKTSMTHHMKGHEIQKCELCGESFERIDLRR